MNEKDKEEFRELVMDLRDMRLDFGVHPDIIKFMKAQPGYDEGDEDAPFFSEAFLYVMFGKEGARTVLSMVRRMVKLSGAFREDEILKWHF